MGGYELIYPAEDAGQNVVYQNLLKKAKDIFDEFTTGKPKGKVAV